MNTLSDEWEAWKKACDDSDDLYNRGKKLLGAGRNLCLRLKNTVRDALTKAKGRIMLNEGEEMMATAKKQRAEHDQKWFNAVLQKHGDIILDVFDWNDRRRNNDVCQLANGETYRRKKV